MEGQYLAPEGTVEDFLGAIQLELHTFLEQIQTKFFLFITL